VRGDHADFVGPHREDIRRAEIGVRRRLIGLHQLGAEDRIPGNAGALGHVEHQDDVAVGQRRDDVARFQPRQPCHRIRPRIEAVPGEIEIVQLGGRNAGRVNAERGQNGFQVFTMQHVEPCERPSSAAYFLHRRRIAIAPGIGEGCRLDMAGAMVRQERRSIAGDAAAPIDDGPEHVEHQRAHAVHPVRHFPLACCVSIDR